MQIHAKQQCLHLTALPCLHLPLDSIPPLCNLTGSFLIAFQLRAAIWVESVELGTDLFGTIDMRLQSVKDVLVLSKLSLPLLKIERKDEEP